LGAAGGSDIRLAIAGGGGGSTGFFIASDVGDGGSGVFGVGAATGGGGGAEIDGRADRAGGSGAFGAAAVCGGSGARRGGGAGALGVSATTGGGGGGLALRGADGVDGDCAGEGAGACAVDGDGFRAGGEEAADWRRLAGGLSTIVSCDRIAAASRCAANVWPGGGVRAGAATDDGILWRSDGRAVRAGRVVRGSVGNRSCGTLRRGPRSSTTLMSTITFG
jgi:hypothetical protein